MSLVRARRRRHGARRPRARQGQAPQGRSLGDHHFEASPPTSVTGTFEATRARAAQSADESRPADRLLDLRGAAQGHPTAPSNLKL